MIFNHVFFLKNVINSVQFKADIAINEVEMSKLRQIAAEAKKFHTSLEQIELLKLEQQQQNQNLDSNELNIRVNDLFASFNNLCVRKFIKTLFK